MTEIKPSCVEGNLSNFEQIRAHHSDLSRLYLDVGSDEDDLMPHSLRAVVRRLRQASASASRGLTDAQLLDRFIRERDEAAFEVLVWRHGPAVLGVCRRALGNSADADDAFQAVFLTLLRKAAAVRNGNALAAWLCRIAFRISVRLRTERRRRRSTGLPELAAPVEAGSDPDLKAVLDAEIDRLPEKFRRVFVLCYLHGQTTAEAAAALGCPRGTVLSRLAAARKILRRRLTRRGLVPAGLFAAVAGTAWPSGELVAATVAVVKAFAAGGTVPRHVAALSLGVIRTMILNKVKLVAGVVLAVGMIGVGAGWLTRGPAVVADSKPVAKAPEKPADPDPPKPAPPADPKPKDTEKPASPWTFDPLKDYGFAAEEHLAKSEAWLIEFDRAKERAHLAFNVEMIGVEEQIRLKERLRERERAREIKAQVNDKEIAENEYKHMDEIVNLRRALAKLETERNLKERERSAKRDLVQAKMQALKQQIRDQHPDLTKYAWPSPTRDLERRVSDVEREVADLKRELRRRKE